MRYGSHLITTASLIAAKRATAGTPVEVLDVQKAYRLFLDEKRSVKFLKDYEQRMIGSDGQVNFGVGEGNASAPVAAAVAAAPVAPVPAGGDAMDVS